jgi:hypothetical protein
VGIAIREGYIEGVDQKVADLSGNLPSVVLSNYIIPAARSSEPLPENPEGVAHLEARISDIKQCSIFGLWPLF